MKNSCKLRLGILSDAPQKSLDTRMRASGLGKYFEAVESTVSNFCMKPYLGSYLSIAGRLRASPEKTLVIGDSLYADINGAKAMGAPNILLTTASPMATRGRMRFASWAAGTSYSPIWKCTTLRFS